MSSPSPSTISTARLSVSSSDSDITLLSIGQHVTSLAARKLDPELNQDVLVVGTQTNVLAYDVEQNSELFYKEVRGRGGGCGLPWGSKRLLICIAFLYIVSTKCISLRFTCMCNVCAMP